MPDRAAELRRLISHGCVAMPGVFNGISARLATAAGFEAIYVSGAGLSNAAGVPDVGLLSSDAWVQRIGEICDATTLPVVADVDTGFGGPSNAARLVCDLERVGLAGCHVEDQVFPKRCGHLAGKQIVPIDEMAVKLRAMREAASDDFLLLARTDARGVEGLDAAVDRAKVYLDAGADGIFPEALADKSEFEHFAKALPGVTLLANMTEFGKGPLLAVDELAAIGYRMVIFPQSAFRIANQAMLDALRRLRDAGTQRDLLERMQTRQELYDLLDYDPNQEVWPR
jgi:methylisocitrate lyase